MDSPKWNGEYRENAKLLLDHHIVHPTADGLVISTGRTAITEIQNIK